jgi:hypothetical protein
MLNLADEHVRHRVLSNGPVGAWRTLPGSHTEVIDDGIVFRADGSGEMRTHSALAGDSTQRFLWRVGGAWAVVECQPIYDTPELGPDGLPEAADWFRLALEVVPQATDAGEFWALKERGTAGLWWLLAPVVPAD